MAATSSSTYLLCISYLLFAVCSLTIIVIDARSVPDGYVYTDQHRTAMKGDQLKLSCDFYGTPVGVFWKKGDNPEKSPDLITDVDGEPPSGSCLADQSCRLEADYTLIIDEVKVADRGTYICRVSNYRGVLIHNFTEVTVYAPPMEPFPVIKECPVKDCNDTQQTCSLSTSENVNITCSASGYYPDIDLFFLHGSRKMVTTKVEEVTNPDGTKNKSISTSAEPSGIQYVCVASDIPGSQEQRTVSIEVNFPQVIIHSTIPSHTPVSRPDLAKVVVPVVIFIILPLVLLCVAAIWWHQRKKQRRQSTKCEQEAEPLYERLKIRPGKISFYELWYLVEKMDKTDLKKLKDALAHLGISVDRVPTRKEAYKLLCEWKDTNTFDNEGQGLYNTLFGYGLGGPLQCMTELQNDEESIVIYDVRVDYIIRQIGNDREFGQFLGKLTTEQQFESTGNNDEFVNGAMEEMKTWRDRTKEVNHFVLISLALERTECKPVDRTFFKIPEHLLDPISSQEVKGFVYGLTGRHCRRLAEAVGIKDEQKILTIIKENNGDLFDTQAMINDWITEQECSNYEKRWKLDDAIIKIGRHDLTDCFGTTTYRFEAGEPCETPHQQHKMFDFGSIFDDDLFILLKHLPPSAIPIFVEKLNITIVDSDCLEETLKGWRDESITEQRSVPWKKLGLIHRDALKAANCNKVHHDVKDDELENILASVTSAKVLEQLTTSLGAKNDKERSHMQHLKEWRDTCAVEKRRKTLTEKCNALGLSGCIVDSLPHRHVYQVELVRFAYNILCHDVEPLAKLLDMNTDKVKKFQTPLKGTVGLLIKLITKMDAYTEYHRNHFSDALGNIGYMDVARSTLFGYGASLSELYNLTSGLSSDQMEILIEHLQIDERALSTTEKQDNVKVMKAWRNQLRQEPAHFRLKLALGLRAAGLHATANDIIAGCYRTTEVCSNVVENICDSLDDHQRKELLKHLKLKSQKDENDQISKLVTEWARNWLDNLGNLSLKTLFAKDKLSHRVKEIDELFMAGFFELAEEIMLLGVSKLSSVEPANKEPHKTSNKGEEAQLGPDSVGSLETSGGDQSQVNPTAEQSYAISQLQMPTDESVQKEDDEASNKSNELTPFIGNSNQVSSESSV